MKRSFILIVLAMVAALTMVSCKNNKKAKEPTQEEIQEMKQALADLVLVKIDEEIAQIEEFINKNKIISSAGKISQVHQSIESAKHFRIVNNDKYIARRNALLQ